MKRMIIAAVLIFAASQIAIAQDDKNKVDAKEVATVQAPAQEAEKAEQPAENKENTENSNAQSEVQQENAPAADEKKAE